jgi:hypothetical protein
MNIYIYICVCIYIYMYIYIIYTCVYIYIYIHINILIFVCNVYIYVGIMDLHNGQISVASDGEGKGCAFTAKIPMLRCSSLKVSTGPSSPSISLPRPGFVQASDSKELITLRDTVRVNPNPTSTSISLSRPTFVQASESKELMTPRDTEISAPVLGYFIVGLFLLYL